KHLRPSDSRQSDRRPLALESVHISRAIHGESTTPKHRLINIDSVSIAPHHARNLHCHDHRYKWHCIPYDASDSHGHGRGTNIATCMSSISAASTSNPTSSLTSRITASFIVSPTSMCPPGRVYLSNHLCDFVRRSLPSLLTINAPNVGSRYTWL